MIFVEVADSPSLSNLAELTVSAWIYPQSGPPPGNGFEVAVSQYSSSLGERAYFIAYNRSAGRIRVSINENTGGTFFDSAFTIPEDDWTHVALSHDGSLMRLYINGVLDTATPNSIPGVTDFTVPIRIGNQAGSTSNDFIGMIDQVRIWSVARSTAEIQAEMTATVQFTPPTLSGFWAMQDAPGSGTILRRIDLPQQRRDVRRRLYRGRRTTADVAADQADAVVRAPIGSGRRAR